MSGGVGGVGRPTPRRHTAVPWLYGLAAVLTVLAPLVLLGVWVGGAGLGAALLAAVADLVAAVIAAGVATVVVARRGVRRVRAVVLGHPDGRAGRLAEHGAARWSLARERFAAVSREYAAVECDPREVAARPALVDVSVPETGRFVEALAAAGELATPTQPADPRHRDAFVAAVDRAETAWATARRTAEALAQPTPPTRRAEPTPPTGRAASTPTTAAGTVPPVAAPPPTLAPGARAGGRGSRDEYGAVADAVRAAAARGVRDLRDRMRA